MADADHGAIVLRQCFPPKLPWGFFQILARKKSPVPVLAASGMPVLTYFAGTIRLFVATSKRDE